MADDAGAGAGPGWPFGGFVDAVQDAVGDLVTELQSFTKFRDRIDELLRDLKESPADSRKLGEATLGETQFGDPAWAEAAGLFTSYDKVIVELETLSQLLSSSIEGMGIAVLASHKGYENIDDDIRERMLAIKADVQEHYKGESNPVPEKNKQSAEQTTAGKPATGETPRLEEF